MHSKTSVSVVPGLSDGGSIRSIDSAELLVVVSWSAIISMEDDVNTT